MCINFEIFRIVLNECVHTAGSPLYLKTVCKGMYRVVIVLRLSYGDIRSQEKNENLQLIPSHPSGP